ncbi:PilN domain-containing protein [Natronospira bacteriovora]|uniref:Type IV pilus assembly protein PilN n=1 Tax=Natronospira bacteriovora TaxID=3069753 RepID=A0ABU0W767_9GAMM|nr:hypothetical protein [Natronospira sp. AB-CW4]MDQ2069873.1 hypothetical protein [Natronospira sp. AB-CW4]
MNQNINLYQPIFRRQRKVFSAETMLMMLVLIIAGMTVITFWSQWRYSQLQSQLDQLEAQETQALERLASLERTLPRREESPALRRAVEAAEQDRALKQRALEVLDNGALGQQQGFSEHLEALGRQRIEPVWLTGIRLREGGQQLRLIGRTWEADQVPVYLQRLSRETVFAGTDFRTMVIERVETPDGGSVLEFRLSTRGENEEGGS